MSKPVNPHLIADGWRSFDATVINPMAGPTQRREMRNAYYAGALILFHSIMSVLDPGEEPTEFDLAQMDAIDAELQAFGDQIVSDLPTQGRA